MAYSNFTLDTVRTAFELDKFETLGIFSAIESVEPSEHLKVALSKKVALAASINTEKARSELIVADILVELRERFNHRISFFSGIDFNVDPENGLTGVCDFLISLSPAQLHLEAPIIILVEAKKEDLTVGLGQCAAEMFAAQRFNADKGNKIPCIYGATTSGTDWRFLKLDRQSLHIDIEAYQIAQCDKILGILASMVEQKA